MANKEIKSLPIPLFMLKHVEVSDDLIGGDSAELSLFVVQVTSCCSLSLLEDVLHCCRRWPNLPYSLEVSSIAVAWLKIQRKVIKWELKIAKLQTILLNVQEVGNSSPNL